MPQQFGGGPLCEVCEKPVFFNEERKLKGASYHTTCFKCTECLKTLDSTTVAEHQDELYCKTCHRKKFGPKGFGFGANLCTDSGQSEKKRSSSANPRSAMYGGGGEKCPRCEKTVYHAEKVNCMNKVWHKSCLRCALCEHVVDSRTAREHDNDLFCQNCYAKEFGPKGAQFSGTTGPDGEPREEVQEKKVNPLAAKFGGTTDYCPRCGKAVYHAEKKEILNQKWHKTCVKCLSCGRALDSRTVRDHDGELYCASCHSRDFGTKGIGCSIGTGAHAATDGGSDERKEDQQDKKVNPLAAKFGGTTDYCPRCGKAVYLAEKKDILNQKWHKTCVKCLSCGRALDSRTVRDHDGELYCASCHSRDFGTKGLGCSVATVTSAIHDGLPEGSPKHKGATSPNPLAARFQGTTDTCPRCNKAVYHAEKVECLNKKWHKHCLKCISCNNALNSRTIRDHDDELYCASCHSREFGAKGYGQRMGGGVLSVEQESTSPKAQHRSTAPNPLAAKFGGASDTCPRCNKPVYHAEKVECLNKKWHKHCLNCVDCGHHVDSRTVREHAGELFCATCHAREFGPKGYGFGSGAGILSTEGGGEGNDSNPKSSSTPNPLASMFGGGGSICPRCEKKVYHAEAMDLLDQKWHRHCLKCAICNHSVDSRTVREHDKELFCHSCYGREFGPKGYGYGGGAGTLSMDGANNGHGNHEGENGDDDEERNYRPSSPNAHAAKFGGSEDDCPRCKKPVYYAEKVDCLNKKWHKGCLCCVKCSHAVDSRTAREHDDELYCATCYAKDFGPHGYGYGGGGAGLSMEGAAGSRDISAETFCAPMKDGVKNSSASDGVKPKWGGAIEKCFRCGNSVYHAEKAQGAGEVYHKSCLKCKECNKMLEAGTFAEKEGEVFCKSCYGRLYGPKGYGYGGGAGALTMTQ
ncbi:muscle LIM protein Mlp84B-like [Lineus longissimus]|uniref:muscle LIM protein Mlp84B-like n=1 Tax=Lineus longissimus TaxID=88925 RepID=UPI002B4E5D2F